MNYYFWYWPFIFFIHIKINSYSKEIIIIVVIIIISSSSSSDNNNDDNNNNNTKTFSIFIMQFLALLNSLLESNCTWKGRN